MTNRLLHALVLLWLVSTAAAFYLLRDETLVPFASAGTLTFFEGAPFEAYVREQRARSGHAPGTGRPSLVVFRDPGCRCAFANDLHLRELARTHADGVDWVVVQPGGAVRPEWLPAPARVVAVDALPAELSVPSAALLDGRDALVFFGPFSLGPGCSGAEAFVETALAAVLAGSSLHARSTVGSGCFCKWSASA